MDATFYDPRPQRLGQSEIWAARIGALVSVEIPSPEPWSASLSPSPTLHSIWSFCNSDFSMAHLYVSKAVRSTSYPCCFISDARESLSKVIENARCLEKKLHPISSWPRFYFWVVKSWNMLLWRTGIYLLGEALPKVQTAKNESNYLISQVKQMLANSKMSHGVYTKKEDWRTLACMSLPNASQYYSCRWAQYTLQNNIFCHFTPKCLVSLAGIMCTRSTVWIAKIGYQIGKKAISMLDHSQPEVVSVQSFLLSMGK